MFTFFWVQSATGVRTDRVIISWFSRKNYFDRVSTSQKACLCKIALFSSLCSGFRRHDSSLSYHVFCSCSEEFKCQDEPLSSASQDCKVLGVPRRVPGPGSGRELKKEASVCESFMLLELPMRIDSCRSSSPEGQAWQ